MKTFQCRFTPTNDLHLRAWLDLIPENEIEATRAEAKAHGFNLQVVREVSWQERLASMENPEL